MKNTPSPYPHLSGKPYSPDNSSLPDNPCSSARHLLAGEPLLCGDSFLSGNYSLLDIPCQEARAGFPRGVYQPEGSFRFSVDALLLASFIKTPPGPLMADLGAGCGVVGLACLLTHPEVVCVGFEMQHELVEAARYNALRLGCSERYICLETDVTSPDFGKQNFPQFGGRKNTGVNEQQVITKTATSTGFDLVLANPPYRVLGTGRLPLSPLRQKALFAPHGTVERFCAAAHSILAGHGVFGVVFPAEQAIWLLTVLRGTGFAVRRVLHVHGREGKPATLVLVEAHKAGRLGHDGEGQNNETQGKVFVGKTVPDNKSPNSKTPNNKTLDNEAWDNNALASKGPENNFSGNTSPDKSFLIDRTVVHEQLARPATGLGNADTGLDTCGRDEAIIFEAPLVLYDKANTLSDAALHFCPYLA